MSLKQERRLAGAAALNLISQRRALYRNTLSLREKFRRYRPAILVAGGLLTGVLLGRSKLQNATRSALSAAGLGISLMRSSLVSMLVAKAFESEPETDRQPTAPLTPSP